MKRELAILALAVLFLTDMFQCVKLSELERKIRTARSDIRHSDQDLRWIHSCMVDPQNTNNPYCPR